MVIVFITAGIISLLAATIGVLVACKIQARILRNTGLEHEAWQHAQEAHQNDWEVKQRKQALDLEQTLNRQVQQIQKAWQSWEFNAEQQLATHEIYPIAISNRLISVKLNWKMLIST